MGSGSFKETICKKCTFFSLEGVVDQWYNHYCKAARKSEEEIKQARKEEFDLMIKWMDRTNNGKDCQVGMGTAIGFKRMSDIEASCEDCRTVRLHNSMCSRFEKATFKEMVKRFFLITA